MSFCAPVAEAATVPTPGKVPLQCPVDGWGNGLETGSHQRSLLALAFRESGYGRLGGAVAGGKNILIFSDGTGQAGGYMPDEARSNVYKLFRATRISPDAAIDPKKQIAFYDGGLGSRAGGEGIKFKWWRRAYNFLGKATGLGITQNIIDCYAEIIRVWKPGDRIYLFGFSRGAYTVRCVGGVLKHCGIPTAVRQGSRVMLLKRDPKSARRIAAEAVKYVYQYGSSIKGDPYRAERHARAARFRAKYFSGDEQTSNTAPYFIGVWDTVGALGAGWFWLCAGAASYAGLAGLMALALALALGPQLLLPSFLALALGLPVAIYLGACLRYKGFLSLARYRMAFYDTELVYAVRYARHALSIDENRRQFECVPWDDEQSKRSGAEEAATPPRFKQMWFAGSHSDVGGSYQETESRLSDIALAWMVEEAERLPHPICVDRSVLKLYPDAAGGQHNERKAAITACPRWLVRLALQFVDQRTFLWREGYRSIPPDAELHPTVLERFALSGVLMHDQIRPYRPPALRNHWAVRGYWSPGNRASGGIAAARRPIPRIQARPSTAAQGRKHWWSMRAR
jgi:uncharacterized protein (DUF2235 family)